MDNSPTYTAFAGDLCVAAGELATLLRRTRQHLEHHPHAQILIFDDQTGAQVDFDLRSSPEEVVARVQPPPAAPRPGRPKLGVVCREISLLPRHWEWLEAQPNGASAALRRLVDEARKRDPGPALTRKARATAGRAMTALAGDRPGYEEASRALYAGDRAAFLERIGGWPEDVRGYLERLAQDGLG